VRNVTRTETRRNSAWRFAARKRAAAIPAAAIALLLQGVAPNSAGADPRFHGGRVYVAWHACTGQRYRPTTIVLACGDAGLWASNIRYKYYGGRTAFATATLQTHSCVPNCAQSSFHSFPGTILLHAVVRCEGVLFYSRATYRFVNGAPYGGPASGPSDIEPFGEEGEPICGPVLG
jgi:hypothetical protein